MGRKQTYRGWYQVQNVDKYKGDHRKVEFRSSWEFLFMKYCDMNDNVVKWNSEEVKIPYYSSSEDKKRRYHIDFWVQYHNGAQYLFEIKPAKETKIPKPHGNKKRTTVLYEKKTFDVNIDKWKAAHEYAKKYGMRFKILTEDTLRKKFGIKIDLNTTEHKPSTRR